MALKTASGYIVQQHLDFKHATSRELHWHTLPVFFATINHFIHHSVLPFSLKKQASFG